MIHFIGAGPGDPELITVKAMNILKKDRCSFIYRFPCSKRSTLLVQKRCLSCRFTKYEISRDI